MNIQLMQKIAIKDIRNIIEELHSYNLKDKDIIFLDLVKNRLDKILQNYNNDLEISFDNLSYEDNIKQQLIIMKKLNGGQND